MPCQGPTWRVEAQSWCFGLGEVPLPSPSVPAPRLCYLISMPSPKPPSLPEMLEGNRERRAPSCSNCLLFPTGVPWPRLMDSWSLTAVHGHPACEGPGGAEHRLAPQGSSALHHAGVGLHRQPVAVAEPVRFQCCAPSPLPRHSSPSSPEPPSPVLLLVPAAPCTVRAIFWPGGGPCCWEVENAWCSEWAEGAPLEGKQGSIWSLW